MKKLEKYRYWLMLSDYDMETVEALAKSGRWVYVAYLCQQAVERQLKGMYVFYHNSEAPKTHNVNFLFSKLLANPDFPCLGSRKEVEQQRETCEDFLIDAMFYYMSDYPFSYKNIMNRFVKRENALDLYRRTQVMLAWLRSFQPNPAAGLFEQEEALAQ